MASIWGSQVAVCHVGGAAAAGVDAEGIHASKWHRAFGGFSLGGVTTWAVFDHCIDQIGCYIPISGDSWVAGQFQGVVGAAKYFAETFTQTGYKPTDFRKELL